MKLDGMWLGVSMGVLGVGTGVCENEYTIRKVVRYE